MPSIARNLLAAALCIGVSVTSFAQGRHDEKPHGSAKPQASDDSVRKSPPMSGGRHDERPHGPMKKPKSGKEQKSEKAPKQ